MKFSIDKVTKAGVLAAITTAIAGGITDIVCVIRHDKRDERYYATLQLKADEVPMPNCKKTDEE